MRSSYSLPSRAAGIITAALILSLALAHIHPFANADLFAAPRSQSPLLPASIPSDARAILASSCADCHSALAHAPFYGHFAPISWLLEHDILDARKHLNLSAWDFYSPDRQQVLLAEISQQARAGHMPPPQYLLIHHNARLTTADVATLTVWTHAASLAIDSTDVAVILSEARSSDRVDSKDPEVATLASTVRTVPPMETSRVPHSSRDVSREMGGVANSAALDPHTASLGLSSLLPADPTRGQDLFNRRCTGCHSLAQNREGPHLAGVWGRTAGGVPGFPYSVALAASHVTWNDQTLDRWLTDPDAFVPNNNMDFRVPRPQERADIITFLKRSAQ